MNPFANAAAIRERSSGTYKTQAALEAVVIAALYAAIATGELFTTTVSTSAKLAVDVQNVMRDLVRLGYGVSLSGSTLTITW